MSGGVRRAVVGDAAALVRLRGLMLEAMGMTVGGEDAGWRAVAEAWFAERLRDKANFVAYVVEDAELGVVSSAVGACERRAPGPVNPAGVHGHVSNISTDPRRRRRGHARACLDAVLGWFREETEVRVIDLNATGDGIELYRSVGFDAPRFPALQLRIREMTTASGRATDADRPGGGRSLWA
ncbi:GNAT family N-acetyltransferase [Sphaerisporangium corydalis]|uniref:GNAT family N-acetyltransferase n=1 Tax=Sphaerisporangium corydalis TaxID=1441875 RepID=A0ABV9E627_9ACTN